MNMTDQNDSSQPAADMPRGTADIINRMKAVLISPAWWSAASSIGLFLLALYLAFLSPLSNAIEAELRAERADILEEVANLRHERGILQREINDAQQQVADLSAQITSTSTELTSTQQGLADLQSERDQLMIATREAETQLDEANTRFEAAVREQENAEFQRAEAEDRLEALNQDIADRAAQSQIDEYLGRGRISPFLRGTMLFLTDEFREITTTETVDEYLLAVQSLFLNDIESRLDETTDVARRSGLNSVVARWESNCGTAEQWLALTRSSQIFDHLNSYQAASTAAANYSMPDRNQVGPDEFSRAYGEQYELERQARAIHSELRELLHSSVMGAASACLEN